MTPFGTLSPTLTFILKMQTWLEVHTASIAAGFPPKPKEQLKKKWEDLSSATKAKYAKPLPEIGDILRPRSIWHAVSNYQDGGIKKVVRRKNKD